MNTDSAACYEALKSRDSRFDGHFFTGVSSTGIYCRPVCTARTPRRDNVSFYPSASAAESQGFRPCLRCRPELAPGLSSVDASVRVARSAAILIDDGFLGEAGLADLAARVGVTDRHLRRVFHTEFGVSPVAYAQTKRLLLAKQLLADSALSVTQVALASGFGSLRRFNSLFLERYRLNPTAMRRAATTVGRGDALTCRLDYRPPIDWEFLMTMLGKRAIPGVEKVANNIYSRSVCIRAKGETWTGAIAVSRNPKRHSLSVCVSTSLVPVLAQVLTRIRRLFDLSCQPQQVSQALGDLAQAHPGMRVPGTFDGFEIAVRIILGQQITVAAATTLSGRIAQALGTPVETNFEGIDRVFPSAETLADVSEAELGTLGVIRSRTRSIVELAKRCESGELDLGPAIDVEQTIAKLRDIPGIGEWTAQAIAMRALGWPDAFPHTDHGVMKAMDERDPKQVLTMAEAWRPWRAYAVMHLWASLADS